MRKVLYLRIQVLFHLISAFGITATFADQSKGPSQGPALGPALKDGRAMNVCPADSEAGVKGLCSINHLNALAKESQAILLELK